MAFAAAGLAVLLSGCESVPGESYNEEEPVAEKDAIGLDNGASRTQARGQARGAGMDNVAVFDGELFRVRKEYVSGSSVGGEFTYRIYLEALRDLGDIELEERFGPGGEFVGAQPSPNAGGEPPSWEYASMNAGETKTFDVTVRPDNEGAFKVCSVVEADPRLCLELVAGQPRLNITKTGPSRAEVGETVEWNVVVSNTGTAKAENVVVRDELPAGFRATSSTTHRLGTLQPGQSREYTVTAVARETGEFVNTATANYPAGPEVSDDAPIAVVQSAVSIEKNGPAEEFVFKPASYSIVVNNDGNTTLENVTVMDELPPNATLVEAGGGAVEAGTITWTIPRLPAGQSRTFNVRLFASSPGTTNNVARVEAKGLTDQANVRTQWFGVPGVQIEVIDSKDPIAVGEKTIYTLRVLNQGQFKPVSSTLKVNFSDNIRPLSVAGERGTINGQNVTFPSATLEPGEDLILEITAEGAEAGQGKARLEFSADFLASPYIEEEPTNVF